MSSITQVGFWKDKPATLRFAKDGRLHRVVAQTLFERGLKYCPRCEEVLPVDKFLKTKTTSRGIRPYCAPCWRRKERERRARGAPKRREIRSGIISEWRRLLGGKCARHGDVEWMQLLQFHHVDPKEKEGQIAVFASKLAMNCSGLDQRIVDELDKCAVLCANCHVAYHQGLWDGKWIKREGLGWELETFWTTEEPIVAQ